MLLVVDLQANGHTAIAWLSSYLSSAAGINIAQAVDIDGVNKDGQILSGDAYIQVVLKARVLLRTAEAAMQSLFDDCASLLLRVQSYSHPERGVSPVALDTLDSLIISLRTNSTLVQQTLEALLVVAQDQSSLGQSNYRSSIQWRMSRIIGLDDALAPALDDMASFTDGPYEGAGEDVVDMELAFRKPSGMKGANPVDPSQGSSTLYSNPSQTSDSSLDAPKKLHVNTNEIAPWADHHASGSVSSLASPTLGKADDETSAFPEDESKYYCSKRSAMYPDSLQAKWL